MKIAIVFAVLIVALGVVAEQRHQPNLLGSGMGPRGLAGVCGVHGCGEVK